MTNEINDLLKDSETFDEFFTKANQYVAMEMAMGNEDEMADLWEDDVKDRAREYWDEYVNSTIPF